MPELPRMTFKEYAAVEIAKAALSSEKMIVAFSQCEGTIENSVANFSIMLAKRIEEKLEIVQ